jgi:hypothetical protein
VLRKLLKRFRKHGDEQAGERAIAEEQMSPDEWRHGRLKADRLAEFEKRTGTSVEHFEDDSARPRL